MQARCLSKVLALLLTLTLGPAQAQEGFGLGGSFVVGEGGGARPQNETVVLTRGTCVADDNNSTTYNGAGFQAAGTGASATDTGLIVVGVLGEDNATVFGVSSMTINGLSATEIVDEDGTGIVDTAMYRSDTELTGSTVNVSVTFSEALTGNAIICVWMIKNLASLTPVSSIQDDDTAEGALVLTLPSTTAGGVAVGVCDNSAVASTTTWANLTEREDTQSTEEDYSNADGTTAGGSLAVTCDWSANVNDASGSAAAFR